MKRYKKEDKDKLEIGQIFYTRRFVLTVDRKLCKGCDICKLICPREAITIVPADEKTRRGGVIPPDGAASPDGQTIVQADGKTLTPIIDVDENKCDFHGICAVACPFSAIKISVGGSEELPAVAKGVFPTLTRDVEIDRAKCQPDCKKCEESCPLGVISVGDSGQSADSQLVDIKTELCAGCRICWEVCPTDALRVTKFIEGSINIEPELCPEGCHSCLDVCPVDAIYAGEDNKMRPRNANCIYCGACKNVCPKPDAIMIERTAIKHSPIESGAWNKGLERITSAAALNKELAAARAAKAREAVNNLK